MIRGYSELQLNRAEEAVSSFKKVKDLDPTHPAGAFYLGIALAKTKDFPAAKAELSRSRALGWPESLGLKDGKNGWKNRSRILKTHLKNAAT
jgi:Putative Zn-dependent protease, contains TPR repeats